MTKFHIAELRSLSEVSCPVCLTVHSCGKFFSVITHEGIRYVHAELAGCCGDVPFPLPVLFELREDAQEVLNRIEQAMTVQRNFFNLPIVRADGVFQQ
ncbi:MAG: hypothetical protein EXS59_02035 [Candidatus Taylorbacteria bacterium]|nr:hypothetical protein [Candidatus Taylorbacteria bacterium]